VRRRDLKQPLHGGRFKAVRHAPQLLRRQERDVLDAAHAEARLQRPQQAVVLGHGQAELGADVCVHFKVLCVFYTKTTSLYKCLLNNMTVH
jgi:hypothetical protein